VLKLEKPGAVTQCEHLDKKLRQSTKVAEPKFIHHSVKRVLVSG
jgi:hypothetical protein